MIEFATLVEYLPPEILVFPWYLIGIFIYYTIVIFISSIIFNSKIIETFLNSSLFSHIFSLILHNEVEGELKWKLVDFFR